MWHRDEPEKNQKNFRPKHPDLPTLTHAILVFIAGMAVISFLPQWFSGISLQILITLSFLLIPIWACYMFQFNVRQTFFLRIPGWKSWIGLLIGGAGMFAFLHGLQTLLWSFPTLQPSQEKINQLQSLLDHDFWIVFLLISVATPICEEALFRGFFLRALHESWNIVASIILVGVLFALPHPLDIQRILMVFFGIYLGTVVWLCKSLIPPILIHVLHNSTVLLLSRGESSEIRPEPVLSQFSLPYQVGIISLVLFLIAASLLLFHLDETAKKENNDKEDQLYHLFS